MILEKLIQNIASLNELDDIMILCEQDEFDLNSECQIGCDSTPKKGIILSVYELQDIITNLKEQKKNCSSEDYIKAINHYIKNDAFIVLS